MAFGFSLAGRLGLDSRQHVTVGETRSTSGAGHGISEITADVSVGDRLIDILFILHRPQLDRPVDMLKVGDTGCSMRLFPGFYVIGNSDGCQHADNGHHNHYFDQGEARSFGCSLFHTYLSALAA
jgi:hypothetical protein